jgi:dolichyl-phosphate beta-glucosyltransferase
MAKTSPPDAVLLSLVLPSFESADVIERRVPDLMRHLDRLGVAYEIIIVDDGSDDGGRTSSVAGQLGARCVVFPRNRGKGAAVRAGMLEARGAFRIFTDVDIPYGHEIIDKMLWYLEVKEFHIVVGDRTLDKSSYYAKVSALRNVASRLYSGFVGRFTVGGWYDTQCGIKGFCASVAEDLFGVARIDRFAFDVELFYVALKRNYDIKRIPVTLECNDTSSVDVLSDGLVMVKDVGTIWLNQLRGRYRPRERS